MGHLRTEVDEYQQQNKELLVGFQNMLSQNEELYSTVAMIQVEKYALEKQI